MSALQKSAWVNLAAMNTKGLGYVVTCFVVACLLTPTFYFLYHTKAPEARFDEREKLIYGRAFSLSAWVAMVFLAGICIVPFLVLSGQNLMHVYYLPVIFLSTLFTAQFPHSAAILVQCEFEEQNGQ
jgi:hypothetical protein